MNEARAGCLPAGSAQAVAGAASGHEPGHRARADGSVVVLAFADVDWTPYYYKKRRYKGTEYLCLPWIIQAPGGAGEYAGLLTADVIPGGRR